MPNSLISIILCTFNRRKLLPRAIESVFNQTYKQWQLIIVDDGSTDGSEEYLLALAKKDSRIIYTRHTNKGLAYSRNIGLQRAEGNYVCFLDSDDELKPDHLAKRLMYLEQNKLDAVFGGITIVGPRVKHFVPDVTRPGKKIHLSKCHLGGTLFAKKKCLLSLKGFKDITFGEDFELIMRLQEKFKVGQFPFRTYIYHVDSDNRLCDLFEEGKEERILEFRAG